MADVIVRYFAAAKEAAGVAEEKARGETLADILATIVAAHSSDRRFVKVLGYSSLLLDGKRVSQDSASSVLLWEKAVIEVLPPFAGG